MLYLMDAFKGNDIIVITYDSKRTRELEQKISDGEYWI